MVNSKYMQIIRLLIGGSLLKKFEKYLVDMLYIVVGCVLLAFAITAILRPNNLITGGVTGLSIILDSLTGISYTYFYYAGSLIILVTTYILTGKYEASKILLLSVLFPAILMLFDNLNFNLTENDLFLAAFYYGIIGGLGVGLILKRGYSTGGTDSLGKIIHKKIYPFVSVNQIITAIDIVIIAFSVIVFDVRVALYAILTQMVLMKTVESVLYGLSPKLVKLEIITEAQTEIEKYILHEIRRGVSKYHIVGGYSKRTRVKVVTICSPRESMLIKKKISELDDNAFVDVLPVISVWGIGVGFSGIHEDGI